MRALDALNPVVCEDELSMFFLGLIWHIKTDIRTS